ncbi:alpha/beta hydrolase family protein [Actinoplanes friuliensis]|uniref:Lipase n=1 Tax=Actinoplanes friuliensis DSM 7358 TaxID=1246995 RepID=U5W0B6_9ACTN|nr:alpha/beta hydrolase [Actinoplanes friuliensis]AGZ41371.1 lipase [Actinoplanes friuliensis DSM 7358]
MVSLTRRELALAALAVAATLPSSPASAAPATARLRLPRPTGPHPLGTVQMQLPGPEQRPLMVSVWYPARHVAGFPRARWLSAAVLPALLESAGFAADVAVSPLTAGHLGAPAAPGRFPVVLYSHGAHDHRADTTVIVQELASHGYAVVTVDHTDDAYSQLSDGQVIVPSEDRPMGPQDFADDVRSVLDQLGHLTLPAGLGRALDLHRIGMFGWSKGGTATARLMVQDRRIRAGLSLDAPMLPPLPADLDRPFLLITAENTRAAEPAVAEFWSHLRGWRRNIQADGAIHSSYMDYQVLIPQLAEAANLTDEELRSWIGTLDPVRAVRIQQAYPLAFFDLHLRHRRGHLLDGPSPAFPEVTFLP